MTEFKNTPEQLKRIAELIYEISYTEYPARPDDNYTEIHLGGNEWTYFDPINNAEQLLELIRYLLDNEYVFSKLYPDGYALSPMDSEDINSKELEQAIMQAVWEIAEEEDD